MSETYDFIVVGSGGGSMAAALVAAKAGARVLIIEKTERIGGSTAMSGGVFWLPNSPPAERAGVKDSFEEGMRYFDAVVGDAGPASSIARRTAFLREGRELLEFLEGEGFTFVFCEGYPDYYDDRPGGKARGRALRAAGLPSGKLGALYPKLRQFDGWSMPVHTNELGPLSAMKRNWAGRIIAMKVVMRQVRERLTRQTLICRGAAIQANMLLLATSRQIPIWTDTPVLDFVIEGGRVCGVRVNRDGKEIEVRAKQGVLLNSGGFARNAEMRKRYQPQPTNPAWSSANPGDTGEMLEKAMALGAATDMLDEAIWIPVSMLPNGYVGGFHNPADLGKPFAIMVNSKGQRFVNEAASYMEVGQAMYADGAVPAWAIIDSRHRSYYSWGFALPGRTPAEWFTSGYMQKADTVADLARACGIDAAGLADTVSRFNAFARKGKDEQFHRGERAYDHYYADPSHGPNPGLGGIEKGPFYAVKIYPGDVGTFGGLMTDEHGAVLRPDGSRIEGLYATGNCTASVMGRTYPGAGASIAASFVFGYAAAKHALNIGAQTGSSKLAAE